MLFVDTFWEWLLLFLVVAYAPIVLVILLWMFVLGPLLVWNSFIKFFRGKRPKVDGQVTLDGHVDVDEELFFKGTGNVDRN